MCYKNLNCPKAANVTNNTTNINCKGHLTNNTVSGNVSFNYHNTTEPKAGFPLASYFFRNDDPTSCPITKCILLKPGCGEEYGKEMTISKQAPFNFLGNTNYAKS